MNNQEAIEAIKLAQAQVEWDYHMEYAAAFDMAISALQEKDVPDTNVDDMVSRQKAIDALKGLPTWWADEGGYYGGAQPPMVALLDPEDAVSAIENLPSAQQTLCGYDIEHLMLIADVLRKENLPPERVTEALTDIGRIVSMVRDEFEETLRKSVEQSLPVGNSI
jgi:hypothetical protein